MRQYDFLVEARAEAAKTHMRRAVNLCAKILPIVNEMRAIGQGSPTRIADRLNHLGIAKSRGGQWWPESVRETLKREHLAMEQIAAAEDAEQAAMFDAQHALANQAIADVARWSVG